MIYTECKPDTTLVKNLGIRRGQIFHQGGKSKVCKQVEKHVNCKGLVDEDPFSNQPPYLKKLQVKDNLPDYGFKILHDNSNNNDLLVLCPRLEEWILEAAKQARVDIKKYNLPNNAKELHEAIETGNNKFEKLIRNLKGKSERIKALERSIKRKMQ